MLRSWRNLPSITGVGGSVSYLDGLVALVAVGVVGRGVILSGVEGGASGEGFPPAWRAEVWEDDPPLLTSEEGTELLAASLCLARLPPWDFYCRKRF